MTRSLLVLVLALVVAGGATLLATLRDAPDVDSAVPPRAQTGRPSADPGHQLPAADTPGPPAPGRTDLAQAPPFELEDASWIVGVVKLQGAAALPRPVTLKVEGWFPEHPVEASLREELDPDWPLIEYTRLRVSGEGTFSLVRHPAAAAIRVSVDEEWCAPVNVRAARPGDFMVLGYETLEFVVGSQMDPWDRPVTIELGEAARVTLRLRLDGIATEEEAASLVGAEVLFEGEKNITDAGPWRRIGQVRRDGTIVFERMLATRWELTREFHSAWEAPRPFRPAKTLAPFHIAEPFEFTVGRQGPQTFDVPIRRMVTLAGRVTSGGTPLGGAKVIVNSLGVEGSRANTDERGSFHFTALPDPVFRCEVRARGYQSLRVDPIDLRRAIASGTELEVELEPSAAFDVIAHDPDRAPINGAYVQVHEVGGNRSVLSCETGPEGRAMFDRLPPGKYEVAVSALRFETTLPSGKSRVRWMRPSPPINVEASGSGKIASSLFEGRATIDTSTDRDVLVVCRPCAWVAGTVEEIGSLPGGATVRVNAYATAADSLGMDMLRHPTGVLTVDPVTGVFEGQLLRGRYALRAVIRAGGRRGHTIATSPVQYLSVDGDTRGVRFRLHGGARVQGTLLSDGQVDVGGRSVHLLSAVRGRVRVQASTRAAHDGTFEFIDVVPGTYHVTPHYFIGAGDTPIEVTSGGQVEDLIVEWTPAGARIVLTNVTERPSAGGWPVLIGSDGEPIDSPLTWNAELGCMEFGGLAPGTYRALRRGSREPASWIQAMTGPVTIARPGAEVRAEVLEQPGAVDVSGTVDGAAAGQRGLVARVMQDRFEVASAPIRADGRFRVTTCARGPVEVEIVQGPLARFVASTAMHLGASSPGPTHFDLPTGELTVVLGLAPRELSPDQRIGMLTIERLGAGARETVHTAPVGSGDFHHVPYLGYGPYRIRLAATLGKGPERTEEVHLWAGAPTAEVHLPWPVD